MKCWFVLVCVCVVIRLKLGKIVEISRSIANIVDDLYVYVVYLFCFFLYVVKTAFDTKSKVDRNVTNDGYSTGEKEIGALA